MHRKKNPDIRLYNAVNLNSEVKRAFELAFGPSEYSEHFYVLMLNKKNDHKVVGRCNVGTFIKDLQNLKCPKGFDRYITANPLKGTAISKRKYDDLLELDADLSLVTAGKTIAGSKCGWAAANCETNIYSLRNMVIDIDWHGYSPEEIEVFASRFLKIYDELFETIPCPNIVHFTGRGFQLWFCIKETAKALSWKYDLVLNELINQINKALQEYSLWFDNVQIDKASSAKKSGLFRMFGTPNSESRLNTTVNIMTEDKYSLDTLINKLGLVVSAPKNTKSTAVSTKKRKRKVTLNSAYTTHATNRTPGYHSNRIAAIEELVKIRKTQGTEELRDLTLFCYYNELKQCVDEEIAVSKTYALNNSFRKPFRKNEVDKIIRGVNNSRFGFYKMRNATFADKLQLTEDECVCLNLTGEFDNTTYEEKRKAARKAETKRKKLVKWRKVYSNFARTKSVKKAAKAGNVCVKTAKKIINTLNGFRKRVHIAYHKGQIQIPDYYDSDYDTTYSYSQFKNWVMYGEMYRWFRAVLLKQNDVLNLTDEEIHLAFAPSSRFPHLCSEEERFSYTNMLGANGNSLWWIDFENAA